MQRASRKRKKEQAGGSQNKHWKEVEHGLCSKFPACSTEEEVLIVSWTNLHVTQNTVGWGTFRTAPLQAAGSGHVQNNTHVLFQTMSLCKKSEGRISARLPPICMGGGSKIRLPPPNSEMERSRILLTQHLTLCRGETESLGSQGDKDSVMEWPGLSHTAGHQFPSSLYSIAQLVSAVCSLLLSSMATVALVLANKIWGSST